jgi:hypothetical protein
VQVDSLTVSRSTSRLCVCVYVSRNTPSSHATTATTCNYRYDSMLHQHTAQQPRLLICKHPTIPLQQPQLLLHPWG